MGSPGTCLVPYTCPKAHPGVKRPKPSGDQVSFGEKLLYTLWIRVFQDELATVLGAALPLLSEFSASHLSPLRLSCS